MTTPAKRNANRLNAQRSTGPKTASGKRKSAANSFRHGLSLPLPSELVDSKRAMVASLLDADNLSPSIALDLADKIVEYERNLLQQRLYFNRVYLERSFEPEVVEKLMHERIPELDMVQELIEQLAHLPGLSNSRFVALSTAHAAQIKRSWYRWHGRQSRNEKITAQRYMRRSTNQLIKALRRIRSA